MKEDIDYDAHTIKGPKRARWYTCLWPACLGRGCLSSKRQEFPLYSIGYDPVGQLQRAASVGDVASVGRLIKFYGFHVNQCDSRHRTSLHYACAHNHPDVVRLLLSYNANIDVLDDEGCTPLIKAAQRDNVECVSILLTQDADPHVMDFSGNTALHHAVSRGNTAIASNLLECNADIDGKTEYGLTPYKLALFENQHQMAEFLMQNGANAHSVVQSKSVGTSPKDQEQRKKEHETFNNEAHYSADLLPFCRLSDEPKTLESMREDKESPSVTKETQKQIPHTDKMDRKKKGMRSWTSETNLCAQGDAIPNRTEKKTFLMDEEKKTEPFPNTPDDHGIAVPPPTAHIGPTSSLGTGDRGETIGAPKKQDFGAVHDLKLRLAGMPLLLLTSLVWLLKFIISMVTWILQQIQQVLEKEDYPGAPRKQKGDRVADD